MIVIDPPPDWFRPYGLCWNCASTMPDWVEFPSTNDHYWWSHLPTAWFNLLAAGRESAAWPHYRIYSSSEAAVADALAAWALLPGSDRLAIRLLAAGRTLAGCL